MGLDGFEGIGFRGLGFRVWGLFASEIYKYLLSGQVISMGTYPHLHCQVPVLRVVGS